MKQNCIYIEGKEFEVISVGRNGSYGTGIQISMITRYESDLKYLHDWFNDVIKPLPASIYKKEGVFNYKIYRGLWPISIDANFDYVGLKAKAVLSCDKADIHIEINPNDLLKEYTF